MKTMRTLLLIGALGASSPLLAQSSALVQQPLVVHDVTGNLNIFQSTPVGCSDFHKDVAVSSGWFHLTPAEGTDIGGGNRSFVLSRGAVTVHPFKISVSCLGHDEEHDYTALAVEIARAVPFNAVPFGTDTLAFSIPAADVLLHELATVNDGPETAYGPPGQPVTGTVNFATGQFHLHVVIATQIHVDVLGDFDGTLTADLTGTLGLPDADADGVPDGNDNCPLVANAGQGAVATPLLRAPSAAVLHGCAETAIGQPLAVDLCQNGPVSVSNNAPHPYPLGTTFVTWSAMDGLGRVSTAIQTVSIVDTTPPAFTSVPPHIALFDCSPANLGLPTATDDCGGTPTFTNDAPATFFVGTTVVTWTATDISGNQATATQTVTVTDTVPPTVSCVPGRNPAGQGNGNGGFFRVSASDHCDQPTIRLGSFVLANNETIKITETGQSGVTLVGVMGPEQIRHFHVGHGQSTITATDASANVATAACH